jgi:hypothetical protein
VKRSMRQSRLAPAARVASGLSADRPLDALTSCMGEAYYSGLTHRILRVSSTRASEIVDSVSQKRRFPAAFGRPAVAIWRRQSFVIVAQLEWTSAELAAICLLALRLGRMIVPKVKMEWSAAASETARRSCC